MDTPGTIRRLGGMADQDLYRRVDRGSGSGGSGRNGGPPPSADRGMGGTGLLALPPVKHAKICAWCWFAIFTPIFVLVLEAIIPEFFQ